MPIEIFDATTASTTSTTESTTLVPEETTYVENTERSNIIKPSKELRLIPTSKPETTSNEPTSENNPCDTSLRALFESPEYDDTECANSARITKNIEFTSSIVDYKALQSHQNFKVLNSEHCGEVKYSKIVGGFNSK